MFNSDVNSKIQKNKKLKKKNQSVAEPILCFRPRQNRNTIEQHAQEENIAIIQCNDMTKNLSVSKSVMLFYVILLTWDK